MMTDVTALTDPQAFDLDRADILNGGHLRAIEHAIWDRSRDSVTIPRQRCAGCWTPRTMVDHFCAECGADFHAPAYNLLTTAFPPVIHPHLRKEWSTVQAKAIRALFSRLKITGISVTKGRGTAAHYIHVDVPSDGHWTTQKSEPVDSYGYHDTRRCPRCTISQLAQKKAEAIILTAFPDLGDRSDHMTDCFDFVFTVNSTSR